MGKCHNKNTVEYKALKDVYSSDIVTNNVINNWQTFNKSEAIPTIDQAKQFEKDRKALFNLKQREFGEALLNNLRRLGIIHSFQGSYYIVNTDQETLLPSDDLIKSNVNRLVEYLRINNLPSESLKLDKTTKTYKVSLRSNLFSAKDILEQSRSWDTPRARRVVTHLRRLFPQIGVRLLSVKDAEALYNTIPKWQKAKVPFNKINSFYYGGQAILIKGRVTDETAIEEILHPFIDAVKKSNPELFEGLLNEARANFPEMVQQIEDAYNKDRRVSAEERELEIVTQALSRHFNNEYEKSPTRKFLNAISKFLEWFTDIINNLSEVISGKPITAENISKTASLTDIAKLLNTEGIEFKLDSAVNGRVRYSLTPEKKAQVDSVKSISNTIQKRMIDRLFHNVNEDKNLSDTLSASSSDTSTGDLVILNKADNRFYNLSTRKPLKSAKEIIGREESQELKKVRADISTMLDAISTFKKFEDISESLTSLDTEFAEQTFQNLYDNVQVMMNSGDVLLTNVVFHDNSTGIAANSDIVIMSRQGKLRLAQIQLTEDDVISTDNKSFVQNIRKKDKSSYANKKVKLSSSSLLRDVSDVDSLTLKVQDALEVNLLRRMVENMGYDIEYSPENASSLNVSYKGNKVRFDGHELHTLFENENYVDVLIPIKDNSAAKEEIDEQVIKDAVDQVADAEKQAVAAEELALNVDPLDYAAESTIDDALMEFKVSLIEKQKALETIRSGIFMDRSLADTKEYIANTLSYITIARSEGAVARSTAYTKILQESLKQMKAFTTYVSDPVNYTKPEYITYVMNFNRYLETFEGLHTLTETKELNATQRALVLQMEIELTKLLGKKKAAGNGSNQGLIDMAIMDYVKEVLRANLISGYDDGDAQVIQSHSGKEFTKADLDDLLKMVPDIAKSDLWARDLSTSQDLILATMDKIFKNKKQAFLDKVRKREQEIRKAGQTLLDLSTDKELQNLYDFMLEFDDDGNFTGFYTQKIGNAYYDQKREIRSQLYDENGKPYEYRPIYSLENANLKDIEYNKNLYKKKKRFVDFMRAEQVVDGNLIDGDYHNYSSEFKTVRSQFEYFQVFESGEGGRWIKKPGVSDTAYNSFKTKYYDEVGYTFTYKINGEPTGAIRENETFTAVRPEYVEIREESSVKSGSQDMRNPKYKAIMEPTDALGVARKDFYELFIKNYQEDLLEKLPKSVRNQMLGKIPIVKQNFLNEVKVKPSMFTRMLPNFLRSVGNFFKATNEQRQVIVNEAGELVDTLPVFYTGNARVEGKLEEIENNITELKEKRKNKEITLNEFDKERAKLEAQAVRLRNQPTLGEVSKDLSTSLIKFSAMAENFEAMGEIEDTLKAMVKAIEMRTYTPAGGVQQFIAKTAQKAGVRSKFINEEVGRGNYSGLQSNTLSRAHNWMKMVFYDNDKVTKDAVDKTVDALVNISSLSYVAFNIFGNFNNLVLGQINNSIEGMGGLYYSPKAWRKAEWDFRHQLGGMVKRTGNFVEKGTDLAGRILTANVVQLKGQDYKADEPNNIYEWLVDEFGMMDDSTDLREVTKGGDTGTLWSRFTQVGYMANQGAEFMVQSKVGMAMLYDTQILNKSTGETLSLRDAYEWDAETRTAKVKDGFDTILYKNGIEEPYTREWQIKKRNEIREVNKQIHGNYAREDRMVIQNNFLGILAAQFHKWVMPAWRSRFQSQYYDQNLGHLEGRYVSAWKFARFMIATSATALRTAKGLGIKELTKEFKEVHGYTGEGGLADQKAEMIIKNLYRNLGEAFLLGIVFLLKGALKGSDDEDNYILRRLINFSAYQADRTYKEMVLMNPLPLGGYQQIAQMMKTPIAASRTLGEFGEALELSIQTPYNWLVLDKEEFKQNSTVVYQNRPRKGELKVYKNWKDVIPLLYTLQKWTTFDKVEDYYIK